MAVDPIEPAEGLPPSPLSIPIFRRVWFASLGSNFGTVIQSVGASWMMVSLSGSPTYVALVQTTTTLPIMLLALLAGAIADNLDRRIVMLVAQSFMLLVSAVLAVCAGMGLLVPWMLLVFTFLIGCGTALNGPAWQASVGDMVPRPVLRSAVTMNGMGFNIARSLGPAIGGAIVAAGGAAAAFIINSVSYVGLILVLLRWRPERAPRLLPRESTGAAMAAGVRYFAMSPGLRVILLRATIFGAAASSIPALMPLAAREIIAGGALTYGFLLGGFGIGAVGGALGSGRLRQMFSSEQLVAGSAIGMAFGCAVMSISPWLPVTMLALTLAGGGWVVALALFSASIQLGAPRWVVARALAIYQMCTFGGMAIGSWCFGTVAEDFGVSEALLIAATAQLASVVAGWFRRMPDAEPLNLDPVGKWLQPETAFPVEDRSGPIVITIEYKIRPENVIAFLNVMNERRRIRLRDSARHWHLLQDLGDETLWVERYHLPTWIDYLRHNDRRTQADLKNTEDIKALLDPDVPVRIYRRIERETGSLPPFMSRYEPEPTLPLTDPTRYS